MVELRWVVPANTTVEKPTLQFRNCPPWPAAPGPWVDVPVVVAPRSPYPVEHVIPIGPNLGWQT